jgi:hypothetical protein
MRSKTRFACAYGSKPLTHTIRRASSGLYSVSFSFQRRSRGKTPSDILGSSSKLASDSLLRSLARWRAFCPLYLIFCPHFGQMLVSSSSWIDEEQAYHELFTFQLQMVHLSTLSNTIHVGLDSCCKPCYYVS